MSNIKNWFALYTKSRHEFKAEEQIKAKGVETYLPTITIVKKWSDRKKKVTEPLFRGYIFIYATEIERNLAITCDAVIKTIFFDGKPAVIPAQQIESIRRLLESPERIKVFTGITKGTVVKIESGPFAGIEGVVDFVSRDESMLSVSIEILNRIISVSIPSDTPIKKIV